MERKFWIVSLLLITIAFLSCEKIQQPTAVEEQETQSSLVKVTTGEAVHGEYIVVFKDNVSDVRGSAAALGNGNVRYVFEHSIKGFSAQMSAAAAENLTRNPNVKYVEQNGVITLAPPPGKGPGGGGGTPPAQTTPWGITRVGGAQNYAGNNRAWIIDTGIDLDNADLNVDVANSVSFVPGKGKNASTPNDENGHGTHVSGTVAAIDNTINVVGVAAGAPVVAVRVLDSRGSGQYDWVIAGIDYVAQHGANGDVANMSLGGGFSQAVNDAVEAAAAGGVKFALAAGNESTDANTKSPASANGPNIYTVSASDVNDVFASFSNYGNPPVDYAAPGVAVTSLDYSTGGVTTWNGTSMATPHVTGILLLGAIHANGFVSGDPDGNPDPIAHR